MTPDLGDLLARGRDPVFFAESILGVRLNPAQRRWFRLHTPTADGGWPFHTTAHVSGNQTGKSLGVAILVLWATTYKIGLDFTDPKRWLEQPYYWFHVAPQQAQAYIPLGDIELLVKGAHPAQVNECHFPESLVTFTTIETGYRGFTTITGAVCQFRTTDERAKALQGRRAHGITFDEAAFENHLIAVINEALAMRLISTGGPLILVSTPDGLNEFFEVVEDIRHRAQPVPNEVRVWTGDDVALLVSHTSDNVGYGLPAEEFERKKAQLQATAEGTIDQQLEGAFLEPQEAFFVPHEMVTKAFVDIPEYVPPLKDHRYISFWDPSISSDPTAGYVLDVSSKPWRVVQEVWERKPLGFVPLLSRIREIHADRNTVGRCMTGYDATSMGGAIFREALANVKPSKALEFGGASGFKLDVLGNLRAAILNGDLLIPDSMVGLKREILNYRLDDKKIQQDRVMALAGAAWLASRGFSGVTRAAFSPHGRVTAPIYRQGR